jgi:serine/threonine protein kinase
MTMTLEQFGKGLVSSGISTSDELRKLWTELPADRRPRDAEQFASLLRERGMLSSYQSQVLLQGKPASLTFGNYLLIDQLGAGASGKVFKAKHRASGRLVAIKVLAAEVAKDEKSVKRFYREAQATARLTHPNIVRAVDAGEFNAQHYMVMEFVAGQDLSSRVKSGGPLAINDGVKAVLQAARGLEFAHAQGIIHRDVKPGNLLYDDHGVVRILDLGLVRFEDSGEATGDGLTGTQQVMGTIDYMSPEQVVDTRHADARSDIYSLGCTLWYVLTGRKLYDAKGVVDRIMKHRTGAIPTVTSERPEARPQLDGIFQKMVAKQPGDRYASMTDVCAALDRYLKGEPEPAAAVSELFAPEESAGMMVEAAEDVSLTNLPTAAFASMPSFAAPAAGGEFAIATAPSAVKPTMRPAATPASARRRSFALRPVPLIAAGVGVLVVVGGLLWVWLG